MHKKNISKVSLGLEKYYDLGFESKEALDIEILKLTQVRSEFLSIIGK